MTTDAEKYNKARLDAGTFTLEHITGLVRQFQLSVALDDDGKFGPKTLAALKAQMTPPAPVLCWPMRCLKDGRQPQVTSGFRNPQRQNHSGADIMFRYLPTDPPMKIGDGGRTAKWWIPEDTHAVSIGDGTVEKVDKLKTGWRVWVRHKLGDYASGYFHLSKVFVAEGQAVHPGTSLGVIGDNPADYDPDHLHFEVAEGSLDRIRRFDPMDLLKGAVFLDAG